MEHLKLLNTNGKTSLDYGFNNCTVSLRVIFLYIQNFLNATGVFYSSCQNPAPIQRSNQLWLRKGRPLGFTSVLILAQWDPTDFHFLICKTRGMD